MSPRPESLAGGADSCSDESAEDELTGDDARNTTMDLLEMRIVVVVVVVVVAMEITITCGGGCVLRHRVWCGTDQQINRSTDQQINRSTDQQIYSST